MIYEDPIGVQIYTVENVLTVEECEELIEFIEANGPKEATITTKKGMIKNSDVRNNTRVIEDNKERADLLLEKIRQYIPNERCGRKFSGLNERFRYYKYVTGQYFKWHYDGAYHRSPQEQSYLTVLIYLNDDVQGGATRFDEIDEIVKPKAGKMLIFDHPVLHQGDPVLWGVKYVLRTDAMYCDA